MSRASFVALTLSTEEEEEISSNLSGDDPNLDGEKRINDTNDDDDSFPNSNPPQNSSSAVFHSTTTTTTTNPRGDLRRLLDVNRWLTLYVNWLDASPVAARCATCAVTAVLGASWTARHRRQEAILKKRRGRKKTPVVSRDWLEILAFGLHGGLVAGPMSYYM